MFKTLELMGAGGSIAAALISLKNNSRRHKRNQFDKSSAGGYGNLKKVEFDCPEATAKDLAMIKKRLQKERQQLLWIRGILFSIIAIALITLLIYV